VLNVASIGPNGTPQLESVWTYDAVPALGELAPESEGPTSSRNNLPDTALGERPRKGSRRHMLAALALDIRCDLSGSVQHLV
jgi:hypothetical protein